MDDQLIVAFAKLATSDFWPTIDEYIQNRMDHEIRQAFLIDTTSDTFKEEHAQYKGSVRALRDIRKVIVEAPKKMQEMMQEEN